MKVRTLGLLALLLGFLEAFILYTLSSYVSTVSGWENTSILYLICYAGTFLFLYLLPTLIRKVGKKKSLYFSLGISLLASIYLVVMQDSWYSLIAVFFLTIATGLSWVTIDALLEAITPDRSAGSVRGSYLTFMNTGFLLAPFFSMFVQSNYDYRGIFLVLSVGYLALILLALLFVREPVNAFSPDQKITRVEFKKVYEISFAIEVFYALMVVYLPLYMQSIGFSWGAIGVISVAILLPAVISQYFLGSLVDKYLKEKEFFTGSVLLASVPILCLPFLPANPLIWGIFLFIARTGIAGIEVLRDAYFYRRIDGNEIDLIAKFRRARPLANILGISIASVTLLFFPVTSIFFIVGVISLLSLRPAMKLTVTRNESSSSGLVSS